MWPPFSAAHAGGMHPYQHLTMAEHHMADLQASARRHRLARRARLLNRRDRPGREDRR
jgi:hypothetical protein